MGKNDAAGKTQFFVLGGSYDFSLVKVFAGSRRKATRATPARARSPAATLVAQVTRVNDRSDSAVNPGKRDATRVAIGGEYALSVRAPGRRGVLMPAARTWRAAAA